ncbi:hypothetical protein Bca4012_075685 [Brassica carinata]|uniref:Uncharacterized protein n=1 Tax=Brassica carinata TaxID=52824 RepID=A0A8X7U6A7_BRACI|nr:hypothetical protein Bca52824_073913 [Brassica carinata]
MQLAALTEEKKQSKQLNQPQQPSQQLADNTAQPSASITTQESSTSGVTNVYKLTRAERKCYQLTRIEDREEDIDPDYMHYLRAKARTTQFNQSQHEERVVVVMVDAKTTT